jgi:hypothetical protein
MWRDLGLGLGVLLVMLMVGVAGEVVLDAWRRRGG